MHMFYPNAQMFYQCQVFMNLNYIYNMYLYHYLTSETAVSLSYTFIHTRYYKPLIVTQQLQLNHYI